jgi:hypothetical protein
LAEQIGVAIQTLRRHYAMYERTAEDDAGELARLRADNRKENAADGKTRGNLSHDWSHEEGAAEQSREFSEGSVVEQKGFEP